MGVFGTLRRNWIHYQRIVINRPMDKITAIEKLNSATSSDEWKAIVEAAETPLDYCADGSPIPEIPYWAKEADSTIEIGWREQPSKTDDGLRIAFVPIILRYLGVTIRTGAWLTVDATDYTVNWEDDLYAPAYPHGWTSLADHARELWEEDRSDEYSF